MSDDIDHCAICGRRKPGAEGVLSLDYRDGDPHLAFTCLDCLRAIRREKHKIPVLTLQDATDTGPVTIQTTDVDPAGAITIDAGDTTITLHRKDAGRLRAWLERFERETTEEGRRLPRWAAISTGNVASTPSR